MRGRVGGCLLGGLCLVSFVVYLACHFSPSTPHNHHFRFFDYLLLGFPVINILFSFSTKNTKNNWLESNNQNRHDANLSVSYFVSITSVP